MHWKTIQRRKGSRWKRSRSFEDDLARVASSSEASEHFTPVKQRERACEVEAFPLSKGTCRSIFLSFASFSPFFSPSLSLFLSFSIYLSIPLSARFSTYIRFLSPACIARARLFSSARFCAAKTDSRRLWSTARFFWKAKRWMIKCEISPIKIDSRKYLSFNYVILKNVSLFKRSDMFTKKFL